MMTKTTAAVALCLCAAFAVHGRTVKVSDFGYDPSDSTRFLQQALDCGAEKVILDRQSGPWITQPLKMRSHTELVFEPGVELLAKRGAYKGLRDYLLELPYCTNVTIRGGAGSTMRMWKKDYQGPDYKHGEWRYALRIFHCENVLVEGLTIVESGGDGIGVTGRNITIRNCVCDRNHRQGISVFNVENLLIEDCVLRGTSGTAPQSGIDFEDLVTAILTGKENANYHSTSRDGTQMLKVYRLSEHPMYEAACKVAGMIQGAKLQYVAKKPVTIAGMDFLLYGRLDAMKEGRIFDIKYSGSYERGKFRDSTQHPMYYELVPEIMNFTYVVSNGSDVWTEVYWFDQIPRIEPVITDFVQWLQDMNLMETYKQYWGAME